MLLDIEEVNRWRRCLKGWQTSMNNYQWSEHRGQMSVEEHNYLCCSAWHMMILKNEKSEKNLKSMNHIQTPVKKKQFIAVIILGIELLHFDDFSSTILLRGEQVLQFVFGTKCNRVVSLYKHTCCWFDCVKISSYPNCRINAGFHFNVPQFCKRTINRLN